MTKSLKMCCTSEQLNAIVKPLLDFTVYCFSVEEKEDLSGVQEISDALLVSKTVLAQIMSIKLDKKVVPEELKQIKVEVIAFAGYVKLSVSNHCHHGNVKGSDEYIITLKDTSNKILLTKIDNMLNKSPVKYSKEDISKLIKHL